MASSNHAIAGEVVFSSGGEDKITAGPQSDEEKAAVHAEQQLGIIPQPARHPIDGARESRAQGRSLDDEAGEKADDRESGQKPEIRDQHFFQAPGLCGHIVGRRTT